VAAGSVLLAKYLFQMPASNRISAVEESLSAGTVLQY
jgi:hypothetical protein